MGDIPARPGTPVPLLSDTDTVLSPYSQDGPSFEYSGDDFHPNGPLHRPPPSVSNHGDGPGPTSRQPRPPPPNNWSSDVQQHQPHPHHPLHGGRSNSNIVSSTDFLINTAPVRVASVPNARSMDGDCSYPPLP
eukprot:Awhi_evm1s9451